MKQPVLIITQTFPPRRGGMEMVMAGLARRFGEQGHEVQILTEHQAPSSQYYQSRHAPAPKFLRPWLKRQLAKRYLATNPIIICDSWKSMDAVPGAADNIILLAHGQEYLNKQAQGAKNKQKLETGQSDRGQLSGHGGHGHRICAARGCKTTCHPPDLHAAKTGDTGQT